MKNNKIMLIGMPCAGKSAVGRVLADKLNLEFMDLDVMVEEKEKKSLVEVMNEKGAPYFRNMEWGFLQELDSEKKAVISPAGSIILHSLSMEWAAKSSNIIFLDTPFDVIESRLTKTPKAVANLKERGLKSIWDERMPIYRKYADVVVQTAAKSMETVAEEIVESLSFWHRKPRLVRL